MGWVDLYKYKQRDRLRIVEGGSFTCNTGWRFYVSRRLAFLRITKDGSFTFHTGGSLTCNTGWQFYVFRAERLIHRYRLNRRLCGSYRQSKELEKRFDTFRIQNSNH